MDFSAVVGPINDLLGANGLPVAFTAILGVVVAIWGFRRATSLMGR